MGREEGEREKRWEGKKGRGRSDGKGKKGKGGTGSIRGIEEGLQPRAGNVFALLIDVKQMSTLFEKPFKQIAEENCLKRLLPPPYLLGFRLHPRLQQTPHLLDTEERIG